MVYAIILAGGIGVRVGADKPKQFIEIKGKPILVHTLEKFENHPLIERMIVVCVEGWEQAVYGYKQKYGLTKLYSVVTGGKNALESIYRGVVNAEAQSNDILVIHDGVRPLVDAKSITEVINDCHLYGGAISAVPLAEHILLAGSERSDLKYLPRENAFRAITPQAYTLTKILTAYQKSRETGKGINSAFIGTLMLDVGEKVCLSKGSEQNIKITDPKDLSFFKSIIYDDLD